MTVIRTIVIMLFGLMAAAAASAQDSDELKVYVFGNSLIHHLSDSDETTAPHWIAKLAQAAGTGFGLDGQWGFLRDFAKPEAPKANWRFKDVPRGWGRDARNFADVDWDVVMFNPANFIQYQPADTPYDGKNDDNSSPLSATLAMIDRMQTGAAPERFVLYEGWADMAGYVARFPPNERQTAKYLRHNGGGYHDWYVAYLSQLRRARPELQIDMIPVASVISELVDGGVLFDLKAEDLYSDDAPHGTPTLYFLAGAISYVGLFQTPLPETIELPGSIHRDVRLYYDAVRDEIHRMMLRPTAASAAPDSTPDNARVQTAAVTGTTSFATPARQQDQAGLGLADPALAMGLNGISDWATQHPFINHMKTARPWIGHLPGQWGGVDAEDLAERGLLDASGWVWGFPEGIEAIETLMLTDQPEAATGLAGSYRVTWQGAGTLELSGRARVTRQAEHEIWFDYSPGDGPVGIKITVTDPKRTGDYIHDIQVVAEAHVPLFEAGAVFNPSWIAVVQDLRMVRFMDWMKTNGSDQARWQNRPQIGDFSWGWRGVPVEVMVQLANEIGADAWFTMPHLSDGDYSRRFATYVRDNLDPGLKAYTEFSNELWNWGFEQAQWALAQSEARWGRDVDDGWMQYAGMRAGEMGRIWGEVYGDQADARLVRVAATHTDWPGLEKALLQAPLWQNEGQRAPVNYLDAYAVTGYFGVEQGMDEGAPNVLQWLTDARDKAKADGRAQGLKRAALEAYVQAHLYDGVFAQIADDLRRGSLRHITEEALPYQAKVARKNGLQLVMYEGGSHVVGVGQWGNDDRLNAAFSAFSVSPELGPLYQQLLSAWRELGGQGFNAFTDVGKPSKWGSWGHLRHLWDSTPRHDVLTAYNQAGAHWVEPRAEAAFLHGGIFVGSDAGDQMQGTAKRDILLAGAGDDVLLARGRGDLLHGGAGTDRAILPGPRSDYVFERTGAQVRARAEGRLYVLTQIEAVSFADAPALVLPLGGLL